MSVRCVIDVNLSIEWVAELAKGGWAAQHWSAVGDLRANDALIMEWARENGCVLFTHDLDFGTALALSHARGPSVLQVRGRDVLPEDVGAVVMAALRQHEAALTAGALVVDDAKKSRVRLLPL